MIRRSYDFINSYSKSEKVEFNPNQLTNMFVEDDPSGKKGKALFQTPGLKKALEISGAGKGRASYLFDSKAHVVFGSTVYVLSSTLGATPIGSLDTQEGYVQITDNGRQSTYVDGTGGWVYDKDSGVFVQITDPGFPKAPQSCTTFDGYTVVNDANSKIAYVSDENDSTSYAALEDQFRLSAKSSRIVAVESLGNRLFLFGDLSTELWYNAGNPVLPFLPADTLPYGCAAIGSVATGFGFILWLSSDQNGIGSLMISTGSTPTPVSNKGILQEFKRYANPEDARAFLYRNDFGHICYQISFTKDNVSWLYDVTDKRWVRLKYNGENRHLAEDQVSFNAKNYVISHEEPILYELSNQYFTDAGVNIRREIIGPPIFENSYKYTNLAAFLVDMRHGTGFHTSDSVGTDDNYSPTLRLSMSRDGGLNYNDERRKPVGSVGRRIFTTRFLRFGRSRVFVPKITYDDDTNLVILGASIIITIQQGGL